MSHLRKQMLTMMIVAVLSSLPALSQAQGVLTPVGTPAPTMKTLDQVQPSIPVDSTHTPENGSSTYVISQPGSYYLTGNLTGVLNQNTIEIGCDNVTLDLKGYSILGQVVASQSSRTGVYVSATNAANITICNGNLSQCTHGIYISKATGVAVQNLHVSGCSQFGIYSNVGAAISHCVINENINAGIRLEAGGGTIDHCRLVGNKSMAIYCPLGATISDCDATSNTSEGFRGAYVTLSGCVALNNQFGITLDKSTITGCTASKNSAYGIYGDSNLISGCLVMENGNGMRINLSTVQNCQVDANLQDGIMVSDDSRIVNNKCTANGLAGIDVSFIGSHGGNRVEGNTLTQNKYGLQVDSGNTKNLIIGNSSSQNKAVSSANFYIPNAAANTVGTIVSSTSALNSATNSFVNISF